MNKYAIRHLILIFGFLGFLGSLFALLWLIPDRGFSEDENRPLQGLPVFSIERLWDGGYTGRWGDYVSDQIPGRSVWVGIHGLCEQIRTAGESNGVLAAATEGGTQLSVRRFDAVTEGGESAEDTDLISSAHVSRQLEAVNRLSDFLSQKGISLCLCLPPRTVDVTASAFEGYPAGATEQLTQAIQNGLSPDVTYVPLCAPMQALYGNGVPVYYRTDHHWTTRGAYEAYLRLLPALGLEGAPLAPSDFEVRSVPDFFGTTGSRSGLFGISPDTLEIWRRSDDSRYAVCDGDGTLLFRGFIDESYLSKKDKYGAFLGGNRRLVTVTDTESSAPRPRLLVVKDSFANSLVPFLARHADLVVVNLSAGVTNVTEIATAYGCHGVLVVWNAENLVTSDALSKMN